MYNGAQQSALKSQAQYREFVPSCNVPSTSIKNTAFPTKLNISTYRTILLCKTKSPYMKCDVSIRKNIWKMSKSIEIKNDMLSHDQERVEYE